jgi:hypothetical protein
MKHSAHVAESVHGKILEVDLHGKLNRRDYDYFVPEVESLIREHCRIRILVTLHEFEGWDAGALWEDIKWDVKHFNDIERLAIVGHKCWHKWMTGFCKPFTTARVRYFDLDQLDEAHVWLNEQEVNSGEDRILL